MERAPVSNHRAASIYGGGLFSLRTVFTTPLTELAKKLRTNGPWDNKELYITASAIQIQYSYWSNADGAWHRTAIYSDNTGSRYETDSVSSAPYDSRG